MDDKLENEAFRFQVGDVIREGPLIATLEKSPMIGIVIKVEPNYFSSNENYTVLGTYRRSIQDRLLIQWLTDPFIESLPEELVELVSRNTDEK